MSWNRYDNWSSVLAAARRDGRLYYHAPLDHRPRSVRVIKVFKNKKIRLDPETPDADKFTADRGHLDRFVWLG